MLLRWCVLELFKGSVCVFVHGVLQGSVITVPFQVCSNTLFCFKVHFHDALCGQAFPEVFEVIHVLVFNSKVINCQGEANGS